MDRKELEAMGFQQAHLTHYGIMLTGNVGLGLGNSENENALMLQIVNTNGEFICSISLPPVESITDLKNKVAYYKDCQVDFMDDIES